jgi:hypothetical protein
MIFRDVYVPVSRTHYALITEEQGFFGKLWHIQLIDKRGLTKVVKKIRFDDLCTMASAVKEITDAL